jgi:hypothetical protein
MILRPITGNHSTAELTGEAADSGTCNTARSGEKNRNNRSNRGPCNATYKGASDTADKAPHDR